MILEMKKTCLELSIGKLQIWPDDMNERVLYVTFNALLGINKRATSEGITKDDSPFWHTIVGCVSTQASGLKFRVQRRQPLHQEGASWRYESFIMKCVSCSHQTRTNCLRLCDSFLALVFSKVRVRIMLTLIR